MITQEKTVVSQSCECRSIAENAPQYFGRNLLAVSAQIVLNLYESQWLTQLIKKKLLNVLTKA